MPCFLWVELGGLRGGYGEKRRGPRLEPWGTPQKKRATEGSAQALLQRSVTVAIRFKNRGCTEQNVGEDGTTALVYCLLPTWKHLKHNSNSTGEALLLTTAGFT